MRWTLRDGVNDGLDERRDEETRLAIQASLVH